MSEDVRQQILQWLAGRDTGLSSECIAFTALGIRQADQWGNHPYDPADLGRCLRLLEAIPTLKDGFTERMASVSPTWGLIVAHWDELEGDYVSCKHRHGHHGPPKSYRHHAQRVEPSAQLAVDAGAFPR